MFNADHPSPWHSADMTAGLHPDLIAKITRVLDRMFKAGHPMRICQGLRTAEYQHGLYLKGRRGVKGEATVTNCDGVVKKSRHQAGVDGLGKAVDCCFLIGEAFGIKQPWLVYGETGESEGLKWGGRFTSPIDLDHLELV